MVVENDGTLDEAISLAYFAREEILARQAVSIIPSFKSTITSRELTTLAWSLRRIGDMAAARKLLGIALRVAEREGQTYVSWTEREYGDYLFSAGEYEDAVRHLKRSADMLPEPKGDKLLELRAARLLFRAALQARFNYNLESAYEIVDEAEGLIKGIVDKEISEAQNFDLKDVRSQLQEVVSGAPQDPGGRGSLGSRGRINSLRVRKSRGKRQFGRRSDP